VNRESPLFLVCAVESIITFIPKGTLDLQAAINDYLNAWLWNTRDG